MVGYFRELNLPNLTVVSPDAGGVERARFLRPKCSAPLAIVDKRRTDINVTEVMHVIGDVPGRTCLILDDIIDTAGTLVKTVDALLDAGAAEVYACASHAVLSGPAIERIANSRTQRKLVVTDSIPLREEGLKRVSGKGRSRCVRSRACSPPPSRAYTWRPASALASTKYRRASTLAASESNGFGLADWFTSGFAGLQNVTTTSTRCASSA